MTNYSFLDGSGTSRNAAASSLLSGLGPQVNIVDSTGANTLGVTSGGEVLVKGSVQGVITTVGSILTIPNIISSANSSTSILGGNAVFTGTSEEVKDFASITISVFSDQASATDGLSIQQSSNGTNWDITDTYTISASTGKTFSVQPAARFFRIVYTNGSTPQGTFRLQSVYHIIMTKSSSQRTQDSYTNETDLEQVWSFNSNWNGTTWDRQVGNANGTLIQTGNNSILTRMTSSVITVPQPASVSGVGLFNVNHTGNGSVLALVQSSVITQFGNIPSIVGTYLEDNPHTSGDKGLFSLNVRNDTMASVTSADGDYGALMIGPSGEGIVANSPITKWISAQTSVMYGTSVQAVAPQGASIFTYITGLQIVNDSPNYTKVKITGGLGSVLAWTIAPANGGSNIVFVNAIKTGENSGVSTSITGVSSVYVSMQGFISKS